MSKAAGPVNIPGPVLKTYANLLATHITDIFNISLSQISVTTCFKAATSVPVANKSAVSSLNDYHQPQSLFWDAGSTVYQRKHPNLPGPSPVNIQNNQIQRGCHLHLPPLSPHTSQKYQHLHQDAVCWFQLSIQYNLPIKMANSHTTGYWTSNWIDSHTSSNPPRGCVFSSCSCCTSMTTAPEMEWIKNTDENS